ncbi:hypothetical protein D3C78_1908180 [compost metagenome]
MTTGRAHLGPVSAKHLDRIALRQAQVLFEQADDAEEVRHGKHAHGPAAVVGQDCNLLHDSSMARSDYRSAL